MIEIIALIFSIIALILSISFLIYKLLKLTRLNEKWNRYRRRCMICGYSRDDIADEWEIYLKNKKYIICKKCKTIQLEWKKKKVNQ